MSLVRGGVLIERSGAELFPKNRAELSVAGAEAGSSTGTMYGLGAYLAVLWRSERYGVETGSMLLVRAYQVGFAEFGRFLVKLFV